jgi:hypothetical protein
MDGASIRLRLLKSLNLTSKVFLESKRTALARLIAANVHLPAQGTDEWLDLRRFNIGGSEIGVLTGDNKFSNMKKLVAGKVGLCCFKGIMATRWGKAFEKVTTILMQQILEIDGSIQETSSIEGGIPNHRYSPDGLAVAKMLCGGVIDGEYIETKEYVTLLFEFKSPYSSIPDGTVPKCYMPQVLAGLGSIPIADFGLFVNNMYRKCSLAQFQVDATYDTAFHNKDAGKFVLRNPVAMGFIIVYMSLETHSKFLESRDDLDIDSRETGSAADDSDTDDSDAADDSDLSHINYAQMKSAGPPDLAQTILTKSDKIRIDFGKSNYYEFDSLLTMYDQKLIDFHYCEPLVIPDEMNKIPFVGRQANVSGEMASISDYRRKISDGLTNELADCDCAKIIGYIPYKLFNSDMIVVDRDPKFLAKCNEKVQETISVVRKVVGDDEDIQQIHARFRKYYPHKNDYVDREIDAALAEAINEGPRPDMVPTY